MNPYLIYTNKFVCLKMKNVVSYVSLIKKSVFLFLYEKWFNLILR